MKVGVGSVTFSKGHHTRAPTSEKYSRNCTLFSNMKGRPRKEREPVRLLPDAPPSIDDLDDDGRKHLDKIRAIMRERGTLTKEYEQVSVITAALLSLWQKAQRSLAVDGLTYRANGLIKANPSIKVIQQTAPVLRGYLADLQLTPASRSRLGNAAGEQTDDPLAELLKRAGGN